MKKVIHEENGKKIAEIISDEIVVSDAQGALDLMMNFAYSGVTKIILHQENITPDFFVLGTGIAGEILQKATNYRVQLAIVGNFKNVTSASLKAFVLESNRGKQVFFLETLEDAKRALFKVSL